MDAPAPTKLRIRGSRDDVIAAIREALPKDAIVRDEDDGVGRFAGERTVVVVGRGKHKLSLFQGNWRLVKAREENPHLLVKLDDGKKGLVARLVPGKVERPTVASQVTGLVANAATVALVVVAYHMFRDLPIDRGQVVAIGVGGGVLWTLASRVLARKPAMGLDTVVRDALGGLVDGGDKG
jgi:hypothetical protein